MKEYLYHGSPYKYDILIPSQAFDIGFEAGCQLAVYATSNRNMALCFALGCVADSEKEVERTVANLSSRIKNIEAARNGLLASIKK